MLYEAQIFPDFMEFKRSYFCPECWNVTHISAQDLDISYIPSYVNSTSKNIAIAKSTIEFDVICAECDSFMIQCDSEIIDRIVKLNALGIETMYCCEGHIHNIEKPFGFTKKFPNSYNHHISLPYVGFSIEISEHIIECIEGLLSFQEYNFIEFEAMEHMYVVRGTFDSDVYNRDHEMIKDFAIMKANFLRFIDELIDVLEYYKNNEEG